jgi:UDP-N-acetylmuramate: L-alanyl-gamma-D-glutamyl-meso-diaminopimelate ligase
MSGESVGTGVRRVHLVAVCGVGMAALAGMFKRIGMEVTGSDENVYPPMSLVLERLGIPVILGHRAENLAMRPDLVVIGNKVSRGNPEVQAVLASGVPYTSFPEALARFFIAGHRSLVVAGTHGKTTSTAMLAWVLECAGHDPGLMIGGDSLDFGGNFKLGRGEFFVVEGDEYDSAFFDKGPKFLHYRPDAVLLNAVEFDHADIYRDLEAVEVAFRRLVGLLPAGAPLVVASDFPRALAVAGVGAATPVTFGLGEGATWRATDLTDDGQTMRFTVRHGCVAECTLALRQPGPINARNAMGVFVLARALGVSGADIAGALASFRGVARRQEVVGEYGGVTFIDDFAHHPTAVAGVLAAVRKRYPARRLWALFEPRSNTSRRRVFQKEYVSAFADADRVLIGEVLRKKTDVISPADLFSPEELAADLRAHGHQARSAGSAAELVQLVTTEVLPGDVVLMMSNGDFGGLRRLLAAALREHVS